MRWLSGRGRILPVVMAGNAGPVYPANPDNSKPVFALLGDSITFGNTPTSSGDVNRGYWHWAQALTGFRAYCAVYAGVGGNITTQMLARLNADVITPMSAPAYAGRTKYCIVMGGVNDSTNTSDIVSTATANLTNIYNALLAAGITPIAMTITPSSSAVSATQIANWNGINSWLRSYCPANGIALCDNIADCLGQSFPATTSPLWKAGYTHDGVHPTSRGAQAIAKALAETLAALLPAIDHFQSGTGQFAGRVISNHAMLGTGGTVDASASGVVADSWGLFLGAGSKSERLDGRNGEWQTLSIGSSAVRIGPAPTIDVAAGWRVGDLVAAQAEIYCVDNWNDVSQLHLLLEFRSGASVLKAATFLANDPYSAVMTNPMPNGTIVLRTVPTVVPASTTAIRTYLFFAGTSGTIRVGRYELVKLGW